MQNIRLDAGAAALLARLHGAGYAAYAVGGCVRDSLLGRTPQDWDLCTSARPELVLDTEAAEWGGAHKGRRKLHFHTTDGGVYGRDYTLTVDLPAMGSFLLRLTPEAPNPDAARISANKAMAQKRRTARAKNSSK